MQGEINARLVNVNDSGRWCVAIIVVVVVLKSQFIGLWCGPVIIVVCPLNRNRCSERIVRKYSRIVTLCASNVSRLLFGLWNPRYIK